MSVAKSIFHFLGIFTDMRIGRHAGAASGTLWQSHLQSSRRKLQPQRGDKNILRSIYFSLGKKYIIF